MTQVGSVSVKKKKKKGLICSIKLLQTYQFQSLPNLETFWLSLV